MTTDTVQVLLATYNGERFLREQMDSLLGQSWRPLHILARDDGSTDATGAILAEYAVAHPGMVALAPASAPTGNAKGNFLELLNLSSAPYVAFADQDDVWHAEKLARSMEAMHQLEQKHAPETPLLVFTDLAVVDDALRTIHPSLWTNDGIDPKTISRLPRLVLQNVVTGCTALINRPMVDMARAMPPEACMHDWWIALLACCFGASAALPKPLVQYRQHGANVVGAVALQAAGAMPRWRYHRDRLRQFDLSLRQSQGMLRMYRDRLPAHQRATLEAMLRVNAAPARVTRVMTALRFGLRANTLRRTANLLWMLWDLHAARAQSRSQM